MPVPSRETVGKESCGAGRGTGLCVRPYRRKQHDWKAGTFCPLVGKRNRREDNLPEKVTTAACSARRRLGFRAGDIHEKFLLGRWSFELKFELE